MAVWYYGAQARKINTNYSEGGNNPNKVIVHIMAGTLSGTDSWFHNSQAQASAHFGVGRDGTIYQWVAINDTAWHAANANTSAVGIENEGQSGWTLTKAQIEANAQIFAWVHKQYPNVSLWMNTNPFTGSGLTYHGAGGAAWGGHTSCPGQPIVNQLPLILARAKAIANPPKPPVTATEDAVNPVTQLAVQEVRYTQADLDWMWARFARNGYDVTYSAIDVPAQKVHVKNSQVTLVKLKRHTTYTATVLAQPAAQGATPATIKFTTN